MSFFDLFRRSKRSFDTLAEVGLGLPTKSGELVTQETALALPAVFACTRILSESIASMPLALYKRDENGDRSRVTDHPLHFLFRYSPNSYMTSLECREFLVACLCLRGNAYSYIQRDNGEVKGLWPLRPDRVQVIIDGNVINYRYSDEKGHTILYNQDEIMHLKGLSTDGVMGLSPIAILRETVATAQCLEGYTNSFFKNAARPSGVLQHPERLSPEAGQRLREQWDGLYSGHANRGKTVLLEEGMSWQAVGLTNEDSQMLESKKFTLEDILRCYRVPPHIAGHLDKMSYNNIEQLGSEFLNLTLSPWLRRIEERLDLQLLTEGERQSGLYFEHESGGLLRGGTKERFEAYKVGLDAGFLTVAEVRQRENLSPLPAMPAPVKDVSPTAQRP